MPPVDLTGYNQLTLFDVQPSDLVDRALLDAGTKMPEWQPNDAGPAVVLMEALALVADEIIYAINRVPDAAVTTLQQLYGITRDPGTPPTATLTFTLADSLGHVIPAGTVARLTLGDGTTIDFATNVALTISPGSTSGTVAATGQSFTAAANGVTAGTALAPVTAIAAVDNIVLGSNVTAGADPESDDDWRSRTIARFQRLNDTLVQPDQFTAEVLATFPQVLRATSINDFNGTVTSPGHITTAVLGAAGALISGGDKTTIEDDLNDKAMVNLTPHVIDPTITDVDVTATVHIADGFDAASVQAAVEAALTSYLSTDTWPWSATVRVNKIIQIIEDVAGVDYTTVSIPAADVPLSGAAPLASVGTLAITPA